MARLAVVSGGGTGIGRATAGMLAGEGYDVLIVGRRPEVLADAVKWIGPQAAAVTADLSDPAQLPAVVDAVGDRAVDVLVNNAGAFISGDDATLDDLAARWRAVFDSNVTTAVLLTEALRPKLRRPGARVILVSSIAAQRGGGGPYSAAKSALHGWMFDLATQFGPEGITANVISPGYVTDSEFFVGRMTEEGHRARVNASLMKRAGEPSDIAEAVRWLAGPGGAFVTGQIINVNGGTVLGR
ncbi:SDR family NAD(P)-dependent oxidoreductase [Actinoplanes sp. N902-109]|uniref:SDR family NAD(P)-dependent oxidoreductase n=1 Tax=Actinoplanes sp. (strain N902-109) TaxID=649831 RepID=UPI0005A0A0E5|nr:SDR family oxidoreductase [Actinoplanes sp. N902-109]